MFVFCFVLIFCHEDQGNQTQNTLLLCTAQHRLISLKKQRQYSPPSSHILDHFPQVEM